MSSKPPPAVNWSHALSVQGAVLHALFLRELHTRFGRENIGYLWLVAEPLMLASVISTLHIFMGGHHQGDMHPGVFTLLGYCTFIIFRGIFNRAEGILEASLPLLYHKMITIFDLAVSRAIIETAGCVGAYAILLSVFMAFGIAHLPARPLYLIAGFMLISWWSLATSMIVCGWTFDNRTLSRLTHPMSYCLIPLSGAVFTIKSLPEPFRTGMTWNPMVTIFEIARYGQFESASPDYIFFGYVIAWNMALTYVGLIAIKQVKNKIHLS